MKKLFFILLVSANVFAQNSITFKDGSKIEVNFLFFESDKVYYAEKIDSLQNANDIDISDFKSITISNKVYSTNSYYSNWSSIEGLNKDLKKPKVIRVNNNLSNIASNDNKNIPIKIDVSSKVDLREHEYCELLFEDFGVFNWNNNRNTIRMRVDFGQRGIPPPLKDEQGNDLKFYSNMEGLSYMGKLGWEFVQAYSVAIPGQGSVYHYIMKRKIQK